MILMSPGIGLAIQLQKRTPRMAVLAAVAAARARSLPLRFGEDAGVIRGKLTGEWVIDRKAVVPGVTLIGALLLATQPEAGDDEDPVVVAARALGVAHAFAEGLDHGWSMAPSSYWLGSEGRHYANGLDVGSEARHMATIVCACGSRRFKGESRCPGCGQ